MIKLKTLILEGQRPRISKLEEAYALQVIILKLLPIVVQKYNILAMTRWAVPKITLDEVRKQLKKLRVENFMNGQSVEYGIKLPGATMSFKTQKLNHGRKADEDEDTIVFQVGYYDFSRHNWEHSKWVIYDVDWLARSEYEPDTDDYYEPDIDPLS